MSASHHNGFWSSVMRRLFGTGEASLRESIEDVLDESPEEAADFSREERDMFKKPFGVSRCAAG